MDLTLCGHCRICISNEIDYCGSNICDNCKFAKNNDEDRENRYSYKDSYDFMDNDSDNSNYYAFEEVDECSNYPLFNICIYKNCFNEADGSYCKNHSMVQYVEQWKRSKPA